MQAVIDRLDHSFLNEIPPFDVKNPSAENIAEYFYEEMYAPVSAATPVAHPDSRSEGVGDRHSERDVSAT